MKFLGINGSARKDGLDNKLLQIFQDRFEKEGHQFEILHLMDYRLEHCQGCLNDGIEYCTPQRCFEIGDDFKLIAEKMFRADGIVFATPSYWYNVSAVMKVLLERLTSLENTPTKYLDGKPAAVVSAAGEDGAQAAITPVVITLIHMGMVILPYGMTYLSGKSDDPETIKYIERIVKNMIFAAETLRGYYWWKGERGGGIKWQF